MPWLSESNAGCIITIHAVPRAARTHILGTHGDALKIRLKAPPVDGKANKELLTFLAERLGIPACQLELLTGDTCRHKRIRAHSLKAQTIRERMGELK